MSTLNVMNDEAIYYGGTWTNNITGEILTSAQISRLVDKEYRRASGEKEFYKFYKKEYEKRTRGLNGNECILLNHILANANRENIFDATTEIIMKNTNLCRSSMTRSIATLKKVDIIRRSEKSKWMANPTVMIFGGTTKKRELCAKYLEL